MAARSERLRQRCRPGRRYRPADDAELMAVDSDAGHTRTPDSNDLLLCWRGHLALRAGFPGLRGLQGAGAFSCERCLALPGRVVLVANLRAAHPRR